MKLTLLLKNTLDGKNVLIFFYFRACGLNMNGFSNANSDCLK